MRAKIMHYYVWIYVPFCVYAAILCGQQQGLEILWKLMALAFACVGVLAVLAPFQFKEPKP